MTAPVDAAARELRVAALLREAGLPVPPPAPKPEKPEPLRIVADIEHSPYRLSAVRGDRVIACAVRTAWGWNIALRRRARHPGGPLERDWFSCDTRLGAELALTRLALFGGVR